MKKINCKSFLHVVWIICIVFFFFVFIYIKELSIIKQKLLLSYVNHIMIVETFSKSYNKNVIIMITCSWI